MQRANSLEKTLMLGKIEGRRRGAQQRMRGLDGITNSVDMNLSKIRETVKHRQARHATVHGVAKIRTWLSDWTTIQQLWQNIEKFYLLVWQYNPPTSSNVKVVGKKSLYSLSVNLYLCYVCVFFASLCIYFSASLFSIIAFSCQKRVLTIFSLFLVSCLSLPLPRSHLPSSSKDRKGGEEASKKATRSYVVVRKLIEMIFLFPHIWNLELLALSFLLPRSVFMTSSGCRMGRGGWAS